MNRISEQYINSNLNTVKCGTRFTSTNSINDRRGRNGASRKHFI